MTFAETTTRDCRRSFARDGSINYEDQRLFYPLAIMKNEKISRLSRVDMQWKMVKVGTEADRSRLTRDPPCGFSAKILPLVPFLCLRHLYSSSQ